MTAVGLDKFKKDPVVLTEIPPVPDEKGEIVEVQVLKEGKIPEKVQVAVFDPDEFLENGNSISLVLNALDVKYP